MAIEIQTLEVKSPLENNLWIFETIQSMDYSSLDFLKDCYILNMNTLIKLLKKISNLEDFQNYGSHKVCNLMFEGRA